LKTKILRTNNIDFTTGASDHARWILHNFYRGHSEVPVHLSRAYSPAVSVAGNGILYVPLVCTYRYSGMRNTTSTAVDLLELIQVLSGTSSITNDQW
jgi:hypothetical protein